MRKTIPVFVLQPACNRRWRFPIIEHCVIMSHRFLRSDYAGLIRSDIVRANKEVIM
jgi:hypothetical protein